MRGLWLWTVTLYSFGLFLRGDEPLCWKWGIRGCLPFTKVNRFSLYPIGQSDLYIPEKLMIKISNVFFIKLQNVRSRILLYKRFAEEVLSVYHILFCLMAHKPILIWSESVEVLPLTQPNNIALIVCIYITISSFQ